MNESTHPRQRRVCNKRRTNGVSMTVHAWSPSDRRNCIYIHMHTHSSVSVLRARDAYMHITQSVMQVRYRQL